ncbi:MAG: hypothetical protein AAFR91_06320 [Pseudomonadota bacterium]
MKLVHLYRTARDGFADMGPALNVAFNQSRDDDNLPAMLGARPFTTLAGLTAAGLALGVAGNLYFAESDNGLLSAISWPVVLIAVFLALPIRRYLFRTELAGPDDFPWIAATLIPAVILLSMIAFVTGVIDGEVAIIEDGPWWSATASLLLLIAHATSQAAVVTLAAAALCYSKNWFQALTELAILVFLLKITMWFFENVLLEIEIVQKILGALLDAIFGIRLPDWLGEFSDTISVSALMLGINLAVIGATWSICRSRFDELLATGEVNVIKAVREAVDPPSEKTVQKRKAKAEKKAAKKAAKAAAKAAKQADQ